MRTNAAAAKNHEREVERLAVQLVDGGCDPFNVASLRWALSRLGPDASRDPLTFGSLLIDSMLTYYDATHGRWIDRPTGVTCFAPCNLLADAGCVGNIDGIEIRHAANGGWIVAGTIFPRDRIAAERQARKLGALRKLAAECGIGVAQAR